jgi:N-methylhydantoinase A/oxoprolinase/acetone carboxylase beta subunit
MHIGIDVGGTNTDAVLVEGVQVLASIKTTTSEDVTAGIRAALAGLFPEHPVEPAKVQAVAVGTTHFTNAVVEARGLAPTAAIRLGLPASAGIPPLTGWPQRLVEAVGGHVYLCHGGREFDGREIAPLDLDELRRTAESIAAAGVTCVAITSIFSPISADMELRAAEVFREELPYMNLSLSHEIGRIGLLERENATVINASLLQVAERITNAVSLAVEEAGLDAPLFLSQNDGTLMDADYVRRYPVATFAAGPTNSMRGAALLTGLEDCIVVDVGGTTTDVGAVVSGFPRPATTEVDFAGVRTNFRMPDLVSVGIGGGSLVNLHGGASVGPSSVGYRLKSDALVFGGSILTATDLAVAAGLADLGDKSLVADLDRVQVAIALNSIATRIAALADSMRTTAEPIPIVLVGGGSILLPGKMPGFENVVRPAEFAIANAIGAAIAQVGGEVDRVFSGEMTREEMLSQAQDEAVRKAVLAGAAANAVQIVEVDEVPVTYLPGNAVRIRVKAVGDLVIGQNS